MFKIKTSLCENETMNENFLFEMVTADVGQLTLSQPKRRNALNAAMWRDLPACLKTIKMTVGLKALIIKGDGEHFSAGADISEFETLYATSESAAQISRYIADAMNALADFPFPTLAMIRGVCVGGGCALALCCDIRFADNTAKFAVTPARLGLVYPFNDIARLIETVGLPNAKDMVLSTRLIKNDEAKEMGLINFSLSSGELKKAVMDYATAQTALSSQSLEIMKQMFKTYQSGVRSDTQQTADWFHSSFNSDDFKEGFTAFMEKRKPNFK
ncbi:MAG: enoyl-CoA hydratase/isomerase family protein [Maricaulaceae bacterium]